MVKYPDDWKVVPLGEVFAFAAAGDLQTECSSREMTADNVYPIFSNAIENHGLYGYTSCPRYDGNAITITGRGTLGHAEYRDKRFDAIIRLIILTPKVDVDCRFVTYWVNHSHPFHFEITSIPQLTVPQVSSTKALFPPLSEQKRIAAVLGNVDKLIDNLSRQIEKKRRVKQGVMQDLLTGKKRLPGFTGEWVEKKIAKCAMVKARIGWQGLTTAEYLIDGLYYLVNGTNIENGRVNWNTCYYVNENRYQQDKYIQLKIGDVLVSKDGTIGKVAYVDKMSRPATLNSGVFVIRSVDESLNQEYLARVFLSKWFARFIDKITAGSTIVHLYQKDIVNFEFPIPPTLAEQNAIAKVLGDMDVEIAKLEAKFEKYRQLKQGLMNDLLTGKVRI